jgi:hypothetical protein
LIQQSDNDGTGVEIEREIERERRKRKKRGKKRGKKSGIRCSVSLRERRGGAAFFLFFLLQKLNTGDNYGSSVL